MSGQTVPLLLDAYRARKGGSDALRQRQQRRLAEMVSDARARFALLRGLRPIA